jgi:hypothetical protein
VISCVVEETRYGKALGGWAVMKAENRFAIFCLVVLAVLTAGVMLEKFWDCRLKQHLSATLCVTGPTGVMP